MVEELLPKSAVEVGQLIAGKEVSPVEITRALLEHAHEANGTMNAYLSFRDDQALQEARIAEAEILAGHIRSPLHGVPLAIKDLFQVAGEITTMGSRIHRDFVPDADAAVVTQLRKAGMVLTGKLNLHEYAWGGTNNNPHFGPVRNPWDPEKIPGGSSGGSGAAVAADMSFISIGTDTAGSVRIPASACGLVGLKPTHGRVSKAGCFPLSWSLDHVGPVAKTVTDAAAMLQVIAGFDPGDPTSVDSGVDDYVSALQGDVQGLVIGIEEDYFFDRVDHRIEEKVRTQIAELASRGARVKNVSIPSLKYTEWAEYVTIMSESATIHHRNLVERPDDFGADVRFVLTLGELFSATDFLKAQQVRQMMKQDFHRALEDVDVIIAPTLPVMVPDIGSPLLDLNGEQVSTDDSVIRLTSPSNLTGLPALTLPVGIVEGMPVGLQIIGRAFDESRVLRVAHLIEQQNPMAGERAPLSRASR